MDANFRKRMRRRLYHGDMDTPSLPLTELTVEYFKDSVSQKLGHVDLDVASNLVKHNRVSPCSMVLSMLYAKRLRQRNKDYLGSISSSDVFFISMMMASKYLYDEGVDEEVFNDEWADNTEQDVDDVNQMEIDFLQAMDWRLFVRPEEFEDTLADIERRLALREGLRRGWFTYSELAVLADTNLISALWTNVGLECSKLTSVLGAAYLTSLLSLLGSTALAVQLSGPLSSVMVSVISTQLAPLAVSNLQALPACVSNASNSGALLWPEGNLLNSGFGLDGAEDENETQSNEMGYVGCSGSCVGQPATADGQFSVSDDHGNVAGCQDARADDCDEETAPLVGQKAKSSLLSIWFLDSLLSQLWSVASGKAKSASRDNLADPNRPLSLEEETQHPSCVRCSRRRRRVCSHHVAPSGTEHPPSDTPDTRLHQQNLDSNHGPSVEEHENWLSCHRCPHHNGRVARKPTCSCETSPAQHRSTAHDTQKHEPTQDCCKRYQTNKFEHPDLVTDPRYFDEVVPTDYHNSAALWTDGSSIISTLLKTSDLRDHLPASLIVDANFLRVPLGFHTGLSPAIEVT